MPNLLADTGFWIALYDARDQHHADARERAELLEQHHVILPWPVIYETLRTRMVRCPKRLRMFENHLRTIRWSELDDKTYRPQALELCFESSLERDRPLSMVDCALRLILDDRNIKTDFFVTFNPRDFHDVCRRRQIELL